MLPLPDALPELSPAPVSEPEIFMLDRVTQALHRTGVAHVTSLLPSTLLAMLRDEVVAKDEAEQLTRAAVGRGHLHMKADDIRTDKTQWIHGTTLAQTLLLEQLEQLRLGFNRELMLGLFDVETHYAVYHPNSFYARHSDSLRGAKNRLLSLVIYLNPQWRIEDGGLLHLYDTDEADRPSYSIMPEYGHAVLFLSEEVPHEVTLTHRTRYSIAAWFRCYQPL